ncbi:hypothetical protein [uncultured Dubosiella sp.]|uniref:hypothetical protein n=1 Tax=uncultured Dubosiella sp. TaxID=1937011 RepID=UPI0025B33952|nr:hypothetical protein [uncultured Dubosiella sp.]
MKTKQRNKPLMLAEFVAVMLCFLFVFDWISKTAYRQSTQTIQTALEQIIVDTYAREGRYPPSLESMIKEHGFTYDADTYMVVYDIFADNIRPRVQVTERSRP